MRGKLLFAVGLATGYVLGTRAGRKRYEQIKSGAEKVWNLPPVQAGVNGVQDFANERIDVVQQKLTVAVKNLIAHLLSSDNSANTATAKTGSRSAPAEITQAKAASTTTPASTTRKPAAKSSAKPAAKPTAKPAAKSTSKPRTKSSAAADESATDGNSED
jgi:hypothetical protein